MYDDTVVLCAASAYSKKFYLNEDFSSLPDAVKQELKIMCTLFTEDVGGTFTVQFDGDGALLLRTESDEGDLLYDDIGSVLKVKQLRRDKAELFEQLEAYYKAFGM